ncbi:GGDEF domain-containing protein [Desulfosporosinus sp. FKA]|uniref:GGDEF domain-containing protein n=1 Tax=Desulfosporosinus sp. FKA TaxID=1969834 RepID=UPI000B4A157A|nr:GGDEF domain-containing protein [Desulfosporosinus sp. FKA]
MNKNFSNHVLALLGTMLLIGILFGLVYHEIVMPYFSDKLIHCLSMGALFGLINFFIALKIFKRFLKLERTNRLLELDTLTDKLTGLFNRRALEYDLNSFKHDKGYSCLFIDIDNFREFNNRFGHEVGDRVLREVSTVIRNEVRQEDKVYRYGGEEIVVLLKKCKKVDALNIAEKIRLKASEIKDENKIQITLSIGVSNYPQDGKDIRTVIEGSDKAMLMAKQQGKNRTLLC